MVKKEKILIMSVDRDNDIGEKVGTKGPIIGREKVLRVATDLGLKDPEDSDSNALFGTVKLFDELKEKYQAEIAVLTGQKNRGLESDKEIAKQLDAVLSKKPGDYVVLVTDGKDDEHVIPIIQSKIPILSVKRIIIRQAEQLESGYYKIKDFIKESVENPKFARVVFGIPAIILLSYAIFGEAAWRLVVGVIGAYLFIKGFKLEDYVLGAFSELQTAFTKRRFAFFIYIVSLAIVALAIYRGYIGSLEWFSTGLFESTASFVMYSVYFFWLAGAVAWLGRNMSLGKRSAAGIASVPLFGLAISLVVYNASELILNPQTSTYNFMMSIVIGFVIAFAALILERIS